MEHNKAIREIEKFCESFENPGWKCKLYSYGRGRTFRVAEVCFTKSMGTGMTGSTFMAVDPDGGKVCFAAERLYLELTEKRVDWEEVSNYKWRLQDSMGH